MAYRPDLGAGFTPGDRDASYFLRKKVEIYGGFAGDEPPATGLALRDPYTFVTILTGDRALVPGDIDGPNFTNRMDNALHVVWANRVDKTARLDGFIIRGGNSSGFDEIDYHGGAMYLDAGSPSIIKCTLTDNAARAGSAAFCAGDQGVVGGGPPPEGNYPTFLNCRFIGNSAGIEGGSIYNSQADLTLINCEFSGNTAGEGGCIYLKRLPDGGRSFITRLINCTLSRNDAEVSGSTGGVRVFSIVEFENCIFRGNTADGLLSQYTIDYPGETALTIASCNIQGDGTSGSNIDFDPLFEDDDGPDDILGTQDDNLRLQCGSPSINRGNPAFVPFDEFDLNLINGSSDKLPFDLGLVERQIGAVDHGAHERQLGICLTDTNGDSVVGVSDLLAVIIHWGACPAVPSLCPGDMQGPCVGQGDGQVNVMDLLAVITTWGPCDEGGTAGIPQTVQDCLDMCGQLGLGSAEFSSCMEKCTSSLPE